MAKYGRFMQVMDRIHQSLKYKNYFVIGITLQLGDRLCN